ncbi:caspase family protein [Loktanella agnita]|uniref:caspase family protein n=1 Tax=Loktanella agnita TaxID=287097 RepID=UPI0039880A33
MRQNKAIIRFLAGCAVALMALPALADRALVVANFDYPDAPAAGPLRDRALALSETLLGLGFQVVRLENPDQAALDAAVATLGDADEPVVFYYAGRSVEDAGRTMLLGTTAGQDIALVDVVDRMHPVRRDVTAVFLDFCSAGAVASPAPVDPVSEPPQVGTAPLPDRDHVLIAVSSDCALTDTTLTEVLIDRLQVPALDIKQLLEGSDISVQSTVTRPFAFRPAESGMKLTAADYLMLDSLPPDEQAQMIALWANAGIAVDRVGAQTPQSTVPQPVRRDTVVATEPVRPVTGGVTLVPLAPQPTTIVSSGIRLNPATPQPASISRPVPGTGGLPEPSIIVGFAQEETAASFATAPADVGPFSGAIIAYTDLAGRRALRQSDPDLFANLLDSGALDPPQAELITALQTELARMNCYNSTIDGQWGPGSRASVGRYYEQIGGAAPSQDPDVRIFRQIALRDDVTCPAVRTAAPAPRATTSQPRQAAPAPAAPAPAATPPRVINRDRGVGVGVGVGR